MQCSSHKHTNTHTQHKMPSMARFIQFPPKIYNNKTNNIVKNQSKQLKSGFHELRRKSLSHIQTDKCNTNTWIVFNHVARTITCQKWYKSSFFILTSARLFRIATQIWCRQTDIQVLSTTSNTLKQVINKPTASK